MQLQHKATLDGNIVIVGKHAIAMMFALPSGDDLSCGLMLQLEAA